MKESNQMTTDDIKIVAKAWRSKHGTWPTRAELEQALIAKGFTVDEGDLDAKIELLKMEKSIDPNCDPIEIL